MADRFDNDFGNDKDFFGDIKADEETIREVELASRNKRPAREKYHPPKKPTYSQARRRKLRNLKVLLAVSWVLLIALLGVTAYTVFSKIDEIDNSAPKVSDGVVAQKFDEVVLISLKDDVAKSDRMYFSLFRINAESKSCAVSVLPDRVNMTAGQKSGTLGELYDYGGVLEVKRAINEFSGITIDKCVDGDLSDVEKILEKIGNVSYNVNENMKEKSDSGSVYCDLSAGEQSLTPQQVFMFMRYRGDRTVSEESEQNTALAKAIADKAFTAEFKKELPDLYENAVNRMKTDISMVDINSLLDCFDDFAEVKAVDSAITAAGDKPIIDDASKETLIKNFK